jgi:four helix bundle protein
MATIKKFEDLEIWRDARILANDLFSTEYSANNTVEYSIRNHITRSSGSILDNIAERFERSGNKEFRPFPSIAKGSCSAVRSQLHLIFDQKCITKE